VVLDGDGLWAQYFKKVTTTTTTTITTTATATTTTTTVNYHEWSDCLFKVYLLCWYILNFKQNQQYQ
jgi:hypothetical protein